ncbi:MAG: efflux RND transporter periplasmic adaptor subunit [Desulfobacterales bacterium]
MKKRRRKPAIVAAVIAAVAALLIFRIFSEDKIPPGKTRPEEKKAASSAITARAELETVTEWVDAVGTVVPRTQARLEAQVSGLVRDVNVNAGDRITRGQVLVVLDDRQMKARLSQAEQHLQSAKARRGQAVQAVNAAEAAYGAAASAYNRTKSFYEAEAATQQEFEQAEAQHLQAEAGLKRAEEGLAEALSGIRAAEEIVREAGIAEGYTRIKAPESGEVLKRLVDPGDLAQPGKPLLLIRTEGGLRLEAYVRESLIRKVSPGTLLQVKLDVLDKIVDARVEELVPFADPQTRTFLVKAGLPDLPHLYPGMYGKLLIPYREVSLVLAPKSAIHEIGQLETVFVRTDADWQRRYVKTGRDYGTRVEILSGLGPGEVVKLKEPSDVE